MMIADAEEDSPNGEETPLPNLEYANILIGMVTRESQIRGDFIDQTTESFVGLKESIAAKGVLEPILVTQQGGEYRLIAGERRLLACRALGMETIPARILDVLGTVLAEPVTNASLRNLFKRLKATVATTGRTVKPASRFRLSLRNVRQGIENGLADLAEPDVELLLADLRSLVELMEARRAELAAAPAPPGERA